MLKKLLVAAFSISFILLITSCNQFWITGILKQADEAEIQFYSKGDSAVARPIAIIAITDKTELEKLESFVSADEIKADSCKYDGTIKFKSKGQTLIDTEFNLQPGCRQIAFVLNNTVHKRRLTDEGYDYLQKISK